MSTTRVLLVDDHPLMRSGVAEVLSGAAGIEVVGQAADGATAMRLLSETEADLVLLDISLPDTDGFGLLDRIRSSHDCVVVMFSAHVDERHVRKALDHGATGFLSKSIGPQELVEAVRSAARGEAAFSVDAATRLLSALRAPRSAGDRLTEREREVWRLVAQGLSNAEIGDRLFISSHTVKFHVHNLLRKLGMKSRSEAMSAALRRGLDTT